MPVYAVLTAPLAAAAAPAASAGRPASIAAVPCVSVGPLVAAGGADGAVPNSVPVLGTAAGAAGPSGALRYASPPLLYFTVPPGTPVGTTLHITATVPAGYPHAGDPAMTVDLTITVG